MADPEMERAIGRLEGRMEALIQVVEQQTEKSDKRSARIYSELETIRVDAKDMRNDAKATREKLDAAGPVLTELTRWRERFIGMMILTATVFTAVGGGLALIWKWLAVKIGLT